MTDLSLFDLLDADSPEAELAAAVPFAQPPPCPYPILACPTCGAHQEDKDGFGVLYCPACGYCTHPSWEGECCTLCGAVRLQPEAEAALAAVDEAHEQAFRPAQKPDGWPEAKSLSVVLVEKPVDYALYISDEGDETEEDFSGAKDPDADDSVPPFDRAPEEAEEAPGFSLFGHNLFGEAIQPAAGGKLAERFTLPPFTVLDARQGAWQDRKRAWLSLGIQSEVGRGEALAYTGTEPMGWAKDAKKKAEKASPGGSAMPACDYSKKERGDGAGRPLGRRALLGNSAGNTPEQAAALAERYGMSEEDLANGGQGVYAAATSIFDPVLCELSYRWFCPPLGQVLDPFAGGSVRGIVAAKLGFGYLGIDLRPEQVAANEEQAGRICRGDRQAPRWLVGDSCQASQLAAGVRADLVFSCPPYADLEEYSDNPLDLSTMEWPAFCQAYRAIIAASVALLKPDRFACFVVGDVRDPKGFYRGLPELTVAAFEEAGARKYNEAVLVTSVGSLPIRSGKIFNSGRKLGKTHQNILIFVKGNPKQAAEACNGQMELPA